MNTNTLKFLIKKYKGKLISQTDEEIVVYIDDPMILSTLFNSQEKARHEYNKQRLLFRLNDLDYEEKTLIGELLIIKLHNSINKGKYSFSISPPCSKLVELLKNINF